MYVCINFVYVCTFVYVCISCVQGSYYVVFMSFNAAAADLRNFNYRQASVPRVWITDIPLLLHRTLLYKINVVHIISMHNSIHIV